MTNKELCKDFMPETPIERRIGYYPAMTAEEYRALPLPMRCATWDADIEAVIFETFFSDYGTRARVAVHPESAFKCLFRHSDTDTQLYTVCAVRIRGGKEIYAHWLQDTTTGAFEIVNGSGRAVGKMGGFRGHVPACCKKDDNGKWSLDCAAAGNPGTVARSCLA